MAFGGVLAVLVTLIPVLARYGWDAALQGSGSTLDTPVADPSQPGYEALVTPTPTMLVLHVGPTGELASIALLSRTGDGSGAAVLVPTGTLVDVDGVRQATLAQLHATDGASSVTDALGHSLRMGFGSTVTVDAAGWAQVVGPAAPIAFDNPDDLAGLDGEVQFRSGPVELAAADVEPYLRLRNEGEDDRARLYRQELFWRAWLGALDDVTAPAAGEQGGLADFVARLAAGVIEVASMPVDSPAGDDAFAATDAGDGGTAADSAEEDPVEEGDTGEDVASTSTAATRDASGLAAGDVVVLRSDEVRQLLTRIVPFPTSGRPGDRVRVRLLDGTGTSGPALEAVDVLVAAGAEIAVFGNARSFGVSTTTIEFYDVSQAANASALVEALGVGTAVRRDVTDAITDLTITIGTDYRTTGTGRTSVSPIVTSGRSLGAGST